MRMRLTSPVNITLPVISIGLRPPPDFRADSRRLLAADQHSSRFHSGAFVSLLSQRNSA
jgi:hypothetical protein